MVLGRDAPGIEAGAPKRCRSMMATDHSGPAQPRCERWTAWRSRSRSHRKGTKHAATLRVLTRRARPWTIILAGLECRADAARGAELRERYCAESVVAEHHHHGERRHRCPRTRGPSNPGNSFARFVSVADAPRKRPSEYCAQLSQGWVYLMDRREFSKRRRHFGLVMGSQPAPGVVPAALPRGGMRALSAATTQHESAGRRPQ